MRKRALSLLTLLLVVGVIDAQNPLLPFLPAPKPLSIEGKTSYEPHQLVKLQLVNVLPGSAIVWRVNPSQGVDRATTAKDLWQAACKPGVYDVSATVYRTVDGALDVVELMTHVEVRSCHPPAPQPPSPTPPGPTPPAPTPPGPTPPGPKADPHKALGQIRFGNSGCTATVIHPQRADGRWAIATAAHCISSVGQRGTMKLREGRSFAVVVAALDRTSDTAWLLTAQREDGLPFATLAKEAPPAGTRIWHAGWGIDNPGNTEYGTVSGGPNSQGMLSMTMSVSSGDSGGGIFREDTGELVATVCCTQARGSRAPMYGGSCLALASLAARGLQAEGFTSPESLEPWYWIPIEIPSCGTGSTFYHYSR